MCHHAHIRVLLTAEDRREVKKLSSIMIPVYASVLLAMIAVVALSSGLRQGELIASSSAPIATR